MMYSVSNNFKTAILNNARRISAHIEYRGKSYDIQKCTLDNNVYSSDTDSFIGTFIAKSGTVKINKQDSLQLENESFNLFFGIKLNDGTIENVPMGTMNVYEKTSDTEFKFMDNKMFFNKKFDTAALTYPTTPFKAAQEACKQAGVPLAGLDFPNKDLSVPSEVFFGYEATCSDVITAVAQASCTFATISRDDKLEFKWFNTVDFTIPLDNQYKFPITEAAYGPINSFVLAREPQNDNVFIQDVESVEMNGLTELKISDNPFLDDDRYNSRTAIWNKINGLSYTPFIADIPGQFHLDTGDIIKLQIEDKTYIDAYILNHSMTYSGGIKSGFSTPALTKSQINYNAASEIENKILKTQLAVDKVKGEITSSVEELNGKHNSLKTEVTQNKNSLDILVENSTVSTDSGDVTLKEYVEKMTVDMDGITNTLSTSSGNNIILDSIGCFNDNAWSGDYNRAVFDEVKSRNMYGYAISLKNSTLSQVCKVANGTYTLSFVYCKLIPLADVRIFVNDVAYVLSNTDYTEYEQKVEVNSGSIKINFVSDTDNACVIVNLMLNKGDAKMEWSLNPNETWSDTVKIGRGVKITSSGTDVTFAAYADIIGFLDKNGNYITTFDTNGLVTNEIVVKSKAKIAGVLIQVINGQTTFNRLKEG